MRLLYFIFGYVYPVAQKEKRREETVERRKTLLKKQPSMCAFIYIFHALN